MNMHSVKANCDIQSLCVPFPAGQWGSHNKQQPKKVLPRKLLPKPEEDEKKERGKRHKKRRTESKGVYDHFVCRRWNEGQGVKWSFEKHGIKAGKKEKKKEPKWAGEEGT